MRRIQSIGRGCSSGGGLQRCSLQNRGTRCRRSTGFRCRCTIERLANCNVTAMTRFAMCWIQPGCRCRWSGGAWSWLYWRCCGSNRITSRRLDSRGIYHGCCCWYRGAYGYITTMTGLAMRRVKFWPDNRRRRIGGDHGCRWGRIIELKRSSRYGYRSLCSCRSSAGARVRRRNTKGLQCLFPADAATRIFTSSQHNH